MTLITRTNLEKPHPDRHFVARPRLNAYLSAELDKRIILVSAPPGYGKTTLVAEWLQTLDLSSAWLSLKPEHNDFATFLAYFIAAIQTIHPRLCRDVQLLLKSPTLPPAGQLLILLVNGLTQLSADVVLVLDDYLSIRDRTVHDFINALVYRMPHCLHIVLASRREPPMSLAQWRAQGYVSEVRAVQLQFTREEVRSYLIRETGIEPDDHVMDEVQATTEGWIVALKLLTLTLHERALQQNLPVQLDHFMAELKAAKMNRHVMSFLLEDVFSRLPRVIREFLMRTSILDQFTAPLCDALMRGDSTLVPEAGQSAQRMLKWIARANLFVVPLDDEGTWYRYHPLFREMLAHQLRHQHDATTIDRLHELAAEWLAEAGLLDDAIQHFLQPGRQARAADIVEQYRHTLLDNDDWQTLAHWLGLLDEAVVQARPGLLLARAWSASFQSQPAAVATIVQAVQTKLSEMDSRDALTQTLQGELEVHLSHAAFFERRYDEAVAHAQLALELTPRTHGFVLGAAAIAFGLSAQAAGLGQSHMQILDELLSSEASDASPLTIRIHQTQAWLACQRGDWQMAHAKALYSLKLAESRESVLLQAWAHLFLGWCAYQNNALEEAVQHFKGVVENRYGGVHWRCAISCLCGLGLAYQALGEVAQAKETTRELYEFALATGDQSPRLEAEAFQAHLAMQQGNMAQALHWAEGLDDDVGFTPFLWTEAPLMTRLRIFVVEGTPDSLQHAKALLGPALALAQATQNRWREVELLALGAVYLSKTGEQEAAFTMLDQALSKAEPGHFIRSFVDLGSALRALLEDLSHRNRRRESQYGESPHSKYARTLLMAFESPVHKPRHVNKHASSELIEPLTARETEILMHLSRFLTNDEIGQALFISSVTVKSHIRNIFGKLGVNRRRYAIVRARELRLLPNEVSNSRGSARQGERG